jgi:hypothetical protein
MQQHYAASAKTLGDKLLKLGGQIVFDGKKDHSFTFQSFPVA